MFEEERGNILTRLKRDRIRVRLRIANPRRWGRQRLRGPKVPLVISVCQSCLPSQVRAWRVKARTARLVRTTTIASGVTAHWKKVSVASPRGSLIESFIFWKAVTGMQDKDRMYDHVWRKCTRSVGWLSHMGLPSFGVGWGRLFMESDLNNANH